jgi:hypothetical protein
VRSGGSKFAFPSCEAPIFLRNVALYSDVVSIAFTFRLIIMGTMVPAICGPPGAPSVLQMFRSSSAPERRRSKHTLPFDRGHFAMPYTLIASPHIHNLPFLCTTFTFFADIADQRPQHIRQFRNELCLWDSGANISHVPRHRVPLEIRRLAVEDLVDIRIRHGYPLGGCEFSNFAPISQFRRCHIT